ncbi:HAMP domain-containing histidine kinase [Labrys sp. KNU-23]|uniref:ATP-binding protein n=1 Tax=Labrys sp. KNU-23 TaxID=2789216 RepID=UPI0011EBBAE5|nr:ATP-binding protein [Labrys sp. KNU-23]QEN85958.1 HAMP domain-containing histidine kinase [Labrys sp. KNU-23]
MLSKALHRLGVVLQILRWAQIDQLAGGFQAAMDSNYCLSGRFGLKANPPCCFRIICAVSMPPKAAAANPEQSTQRFPDLHALEPLKGPSPPDRVQHNDPSSGSALRTDSVSKGFDIQALATHCVADSGPGLVPQALPHLFDPFFTRRRGGTGLGLATVRRIVDEHHGIVEPGDNPTGGTAMTVRLPAAASKD